MPLIVFIRNRLKYALNGRYVSPPSCATKKEKAGRQEKEKP